MPRYAKTIFDCCTIESTKLCRLSAIKVQMELGKVGYLEEIADAVKRWHNYMNLVTFYKIII